MHQAIGGLAGSTTVMRRPPIGGVARLDPAVMPLDDGARGGEAAARAARRVLCIGTVKGLEQLLGEVDVDARGVVVDDQSPRILLAFEAEDDPSATRDIAHRIFDQRPEQLLDPLGVPLHQDGVGRQVARFEPHARRLGALAVAPNRVVDQRARIDIGEA
ncbi:hypothetical protein LRS12_18000 [Sphingomonas sp. J344]|nr:hypothetical protein [Sphingomonas sp. J344]MCR5872433.1 hypothetical protein [Sphingomonas sp. J344]